MNRILLWAAAGFAAAMVFLTLPIYAEEPDELLFSDKSLSGDGFSWDTRTLILNNYDGKAIKIDKEAEIVLTGENRIHSKRLSGITAKEGLVIDGKGAGSLEITAENAFGIEAGKYLTIKDAGLDICSTGELAACGIYVSGVDESQRILIQNISGTITASAEEPDIAAIHGSIPIVVENAKADKNIGVFIDTDGPECREYSFVKGDRTVFHDETLFENERAGQVTFVSDGIKRRAKNVIVAGEILNLDSFMSQDEKNIRYSLKSRRMKRFAAISGNVIKGRRKGDLMIQAIDNEGNILSEKGLTVIRKPRLKYLKTPLKEGDTIDSCACFKPKDMVTAPDSWESSDESVACVNNQGIVTAKGKGRVKITAHFGNVKVSSILRVR